MKKFLLPALAAGLALIVSSPAPADDSSSRTAGKTRVVSTIFPPYDFARALGGSLIEVDMLLNPGAESHSFEPSPQDIIRIKNCDIFIYTGGESERWVERVLQAVERPEIKVISMLECVSPLEEELVPGMEAEEEGEEEAEYDEHIWTSPRNAQAVVRTIAAALRQADEANADFYRQKEEEYLSRLEALDRAFRETVAKGARKTIVFGDRFPFRYLSEEYGLDYFAAFPGCSTETEASAATIAFLIDKVKAEHIPTVFHIELSNEKIADSICESSGAAKRLMHSGHNLSSQDFAAGRTYLELMEANLDALREGLN
ncbi:MAG: metal ABC transporter substrate-binding protein [Desulfarculales bacterium]|jgi:zinc transport system substrate-binding protein|nr:metal ABC transporter substrate-binding protein [Desulfarculales bacterium]